MARYLITGGAGFIGSALARRLLADSHDVVIVDNLSTGLAENLPANAVFIHADLANPDSVGLLPDGTVDAVIHLAAQSSGAIGQKAPYADLQSNVGATMLMSRWALDRNIERFVYASSMTVYGRDNLTPVPETAPTVPISYYGVSKLASENYLRVAAAEGLNSTCLRLYNVYGEGQNLGNLHQGMASIYLAYLLQKDPVPVTGSLSRYRDLCHIDDVVDAFLLTLARGQTDSFVYNIGTGIKTTVSELLRELIKACGLPEDHPILELPGSASDVFGSVADWSRAASELHWRPRVGVLEGIDRMVAWAKGR